MYSRPSRSEHGAIPASMEEKLLVRIKESKKTDTNFVIVCLSKLLFSIRFLVICMKYAVIEIIVTSITIFINIKKTAPRLNAFFLACQIKTQVYNKALKISIDKIKANYT